MPAKNVLKEYQENGIYHIYNRGVEKRSIFMDKHDYMTFLYFLRLYLTDPPKESTTKNLNPLTPIKKNFADKINLLCFCLMPNHFHLLVKQTGEKDIVEFMRCVITSYSMYFNRKHSRIGSLFQGRYRAILVQKDNYLLHLSRYIHLNPVQKKLVRKPENYNYSSYNSYLGNNKSLWVKPNLILEYFASNKNDPTVNNSYYKNFIEDTEIISEEIIGKIILE